MWGGLIALLAAAAFGFNNAAIRRGVLSGSVLQAMSITVPMGVPFILIIAILTGQLANLGEFPLSSYFFLAGAGVLHFCWGRYCNYRSTRAIGGNLSGPWKQSNLILALVLAMILLGETLTPLKILGIGLIVSGVMATTHAARLARRKEKANAKELEEKGEKPEKKPGEFVPNYKEGYLFALLSATGYGVSPVLVRMGLDDVGPSFSVIGAFISYFSAAVVVGLIILLGRQWSHIREMQRTSVKWFSLAGALVGTSQTLRYVALSMAPVSVVTPIQSTSALFRVLFAWFINREHEVFGIWIIVGVLLSMTGVTALSISTELFLEWFTLPELFQQAVNWEWP